MNQYKQAWMIACDILPQAVPSDSKPQSESNGLDDYVIDSVQDYFVEIAIITGLSYMATNQFSNPLLRSTVGFVGSFGLRLLPVVGAIAIAYSIYDWLDD